MEVETTVHRVDGTIIQEMRIVESVDTQGLYHVARADNEDEVHILTSRIPLIFQRPG